MHIFLRLTPVLKHITFSELKCKPRNHAFNSSEIGTFNIRQLKQALDCSVIIKTILNFALFKLRLTFWSS